MRTTNAIYQERINRVLDYIAAHLDEDLPLRKLSRVACFSPFHFHRLFLGFTGETLNEHVRRTRLERAAALLRASPERRITDVALTVGFAGVAEFSRAFKRHFGLNASAWDRRALLPNSKIGKAPLPFPIYSVEELEAWKGSKGLRVRVTTFPSARYTYIRVHNPFGSERLAQAYRDLMQWLAERGVALRDTVIAGMSQDDAAITPHEKYRYDIGAAFAIADEPGILRDALRERGGRHREPPASRSGFSNRIFPAGRVAVMRATGSLDDVGRVWQYLYRCWLPASRYEPGDSPAMEIFLSLPETLNSEHFDLYACVPVREI
jgi:AraC family transcriptional regulator